jgi:hypothetical protein
MVRASQFLILVAIALLVILVGPSGPILTELSADSPIPATAPQAACGDETAAIPAGLHVTIPRGEVPSIDAGRVLTLYRPDGLDMNAAREAGREISRLLLHQLPYNVDAADATNRRAVFAMAAQLGAERSFILAARDCLRAEIALTAATQARLDRLDARYGGDGSISELLRRVEGYAEQAQDLIQDIPVDAAARRDTYGETRPELTAAVARAAP